MSVNFERGIVCLSLDFELVWGSRDLVDDPSHLIQMARITRERVFDVLLGLLEDRDITATWATVGHLFLERGGPAGQGLVSPRHAWRPDWFDGIPEGTEADHPAYFARSLLLRLRDAGQEIGSHSFSHPIFGDPGCSRDCAEADLARCIAEAAALEIPLRSFVFPRNINGHQHLLAQHGFTCWRGGEPAWFHSPLLPDVASRLGHFASVAAATCPPTVMPLRDAHGLWNIPASASFLPVEGVRRLIPIRQRVRRCLRGIDKAVEDKAIFHLYLHPINLAGDPPGMLGGLERVLDYAARRRDAGELEILSMAAIAERAEASAVSLKSPGGAAPSAQSSAG